VLFLDEPTSGLDATASSELMQYLQRLSSSGLTIGAVIHQPRVEIFYSVHDVLFLGKEGRVAYYGPAKVSQSGLADPWIVLVLTRQSRPYVCSRTRSGTSRASG
jgi:ABC-type multidrug transport system ATPase subunit